MSAEATAGGGTGKGGEFFDTAVGGPRLAASLRVQHSDIVGYGEIAYDWLAVSMGHPAVCYASSRGGCKPSYPEFAGPVASVGALFRPASAAEIRVGVGGAAYVAGGTRVGAMVVNLDGALFPMAHVGGVAGLRHILIPRYRGDRLSITPFLIGIRVR